MIEEFDGSFLIRAFLIERECVYRSTMGSIVCVQTYILCLCNHNGGHHGVGELLCGLLWIYSQEHQITLLFDGVLQTWHFQIFFSVKKDNSGIGREIKVKSITFSSNSSSLAKRTFRCLSHSSWQNPKPFNSIWDNITREGISTFLKISYNPSDFNLDTKGSY